MSFCRRLIRRYHSLRCTVKCTVWFFICSFLQKGISIITTPIFTRLLSPGEYGQYNVFNSWMGVVSVFVTLNICWGFYPQGVVKAGEDKDKFSASLQGLTIMMVGIWMAVYLLFSRFWNRLFGLTTIQMLAMLVMIWTSTTFNFWTFEQRTFLRYRELVFVTLLVSVAKPAVGVYFVINAHDRVTARILGLMLVELICYSWTCVIQLYRGKCFYSKKYWFNALAVGVTLMPHYLSQSVLANSDRIMIKLICGETQSGIYSLAYSISMIMTVVDSALSATLSPWTYKKIKDGKAEEICMPVYLSLFFMALLNIVLIALAPEIIRFFAPKEYYDAIYLIPPIAMSEYFMHAYNSFSRIEFYFGKTKYISGATMLSAIVNVILNWIFIPRFGYYAAGYTTLACYILYALFHYLCQRNVSKRYLNNIEIYNFSIIFTITGIFLLIGFIFLIIYNWTWIRYLLIVILLLGLVIKYKFFLKVIIEFVNDRESHVM